MATDHHLGGYWPGGDPYSWTPTLWKWLVETHDVRSMIDVGCGEGHAMREFRRLGCEAEGVDGVALGAGAILHDYTLGPYSPSRRYDLAWSCEFVEHVEEQYVPNFLATFQAANLLLLTHGVPGQAGHHHVNCQWAGYWLELLGTKGWAYDFEMTEKARELAKLDNSLAYFAMTGLALWRP